MLNYADCPFSTNRTWIFWTPTPMTEIGLIGLLPPISTTTPHVRVGLGLDWTGLDWTRMNSQCKIVGSGICLQPGMRMTSSTSKWQCGVLPDAVHPYSLSQSVQFCVSGSCRGGRSGFNQTSFLKSSSPPGTCMPDLFRLWTGLLNVRWQCSLLTSCSVLSSLTSLHQPDPIYQGEGVRD